MKRSNILWLLAILVATAPIGTGGAVVTTGVGSARVSAVPLHVSIGGVSADLLDISLRATTDPQRAGTTSRSANARLTALRLQGPVPLTLGEMETGAADGESVQDDEEDVPLDVPGLVLATLQSAAAAASVDDDGSRASAGATLIDFSLGGGLIEADTISSEMTVEATATSVTSTKIVDLPSVSLLRVGELADAAGVALESLGTDELLAIANTLALEAEGAFGDLLQQEQDQSDQLAAAEDALAAAQAEAQADLAAAQEALADAQAQLVVDEAAVAAASAAVDAATVAVADAESALASAQAALDDAEADLATLASLTLLDSDAIATLQALAMKYGVAGTVTALNFVTMLADVTTAAQAVAGAAEFAVAAAQDDLDAAENVLAVEQDALASAEAAVASTETLIASLESEITTLTATLTTLSADIAALEATIAALEVALDGTIAALAVFEEDLRTLVGEASIVTFEGVHIVVQSVATAGGGVAEVDVSFDELFIGTATAAVSVSGTEAAVTLLPPIAEAVNEVGAVFGLPAIDVSVLETDSSSGTDGDGYRYATASFTLLTLSVPTPDGETLTLSVGDPEVFAEFAPSGGGGGDDDDDGGDDDGSGGGGSGDDPLGAPGPRLPNTGVSTAVLPAMITLTAAAGIAWSLRRRPRLHR